MTWVCACCAWRAVCGGINTNHACVHQSGGAHQGMHVGIRVGTYIKVCVQISGGSVHQCMHMGIRVGLYTNACMWTSEWGCTPQHACICWGLHDGKHVKTRSVYKMACMRSEDNFMESWLSFRAYIGSEDPTQVSWLAQQACLPTKSSCWSGCVSPMD